MYFTQQHFPKEAPYKEVKLKPDAQAPKPASRKSPDRTARKQLTKALGYLKKHNIFRNNMIEQNHREIKQRYGPMRCFGNFHSAERFCRAFDELKNFYKIIGDRNTKRTLAGRRKNYIEKTAIFNELLMDVA